MSIYVEDFDSKEDVARQFEVSLDVLENCNIIYASYECGNYEGSAFVLYEEGGKFYEVNGSHCSCYGLEGQWDPEETNVEALQYRLLHGNLSEMFDGYDKDVLEVLKHYHKPVEVKLDNLKPNHRYKLD